jgi:sugar phosphate isomerase/epimerase
MTSILSFQLWSSRKDDSLSRQLRVLKDAGYDDVQPHHAQYDDPPGLRRQLDDANLTAQSSHIHYDMLSDERFKTTVETMRVIGTELVIMPWLPDALIPTDGDGWRAVGRRMSDMAKRFNDEGLRFAWHNHGAEVTPLGDGSYPIEHLLGDDLLWEIDIGWTVSAGSDPSIWLKRYAGRVPAIHVKDVPRAGEGIPEELGQTIVGAGQIDWDRLWNECIEAGARLMVAEHDQPADYARFARESAVKMKALQRKEPHPGSGRD